MQVMTLPEVCLGVIGFFLAFLIPAAILIAVAKAKKKKPTLFVVHVGFGIVWFVGSLILIPVGPQGRQLPWLTVAAWALGAGVVGFLGSTFVDGLMHVLHLPNTETAIREFESMRARRQNESRGSENTNLTNVKPTGDNKPGE